ncbi:hypothetical protein ACH5RR_011758 [Cinchona calisaya]|uniref:Uncharacterized protein n=1 Tax=Cinchona calisaya TaxID=153742 RepID=A0ABD3A9F7_9GENT
MLTETKLQNALLEARLSSLEIKVDSQSKHLDRLLKLKSVDERNGIFTAKKRSFNEVGDSSKDGVKFVWVEYSKKRIVEEVSNYKYAAFYENKVDPDPSLNYLETRKGTKDAEKLSKDFECNM